MTGRNVGLAIMCSSMTRIGWTHITEELVAMVEDDAARDRFKKELGEILTHTERIMGPRESHEFYRFFSRNRDAS